MKVVDPHVHIWDLSTGLYPGLEKPSVGFIGSNASIARSYLLDELLAEGAGEIDVVKIVNIEAFPTDTVAETEYLQAQADCTDYPQGIVAGADLSQPDVEAKLATQAAFANVRGIRQVLNTHRNALYAYTAKDYMADPRWRRNFALLAKYDLSFDMQLYPHQMTAAAAVAAENERVNIVVNHAGMFADRTLEGWREWRAGLRTLAGCDNVSVKISGLGMFDHRWTVESIRPYVLETLDAFGIGRAMFASNFPVDKLFATYGDTWNAFAAITADLREGEREALFRANAERIYRL